MEVGQIAVNYQSLFLHVFIYIFICVIFMCVYMYTHTYLNSVLSFIYLPIGRLEFNVKSNKFRQILYGLISSVNF